MAVLGGRAEPHRRPNMAGGNFSIYRPPQPYKADPPADHFFSGGTGVGFSDFATTPATSFWKSGRPRTASKSGSFNSLGRAQPALTRSARADTDWSAKALASSLVTPDVASPPSPASSASARD